MSARAPVSEGFAAVTRQPAIVLAEIAWRWTWGLMAVAFAAFGALQYLHSLTVSDADLAALRSDIPALVAQAVVNIVEGSGPRLALITIVVATALAAAWMVAAAWGRAATLRALLGQSTSQVRALLGLSFLRAAAALAAVLAVVAATIIAGLAAARGFETRPGVFLAVFLSLALVVAMLWAVLNWYLSLAPLFAVRDGRDTFGAIADSVAALRRLPAEFTRIGLAFGGMRLGAMAGFTVLALAPLAMLATPPRAAAVVALALVALAYFAVSDVLYIARLAAYVEALRPEEPNLATEAQSHREGPDLTVPAVVDGGNAGHETA